MYDLIRDAPLGQAIRFLSENRLLKYPEEEDDFVLPQTYLEILEGREKPPHLQPEPSPQAQDDADSSSDSADPDIELGRTHTRRSSVVGPRFSMERVQEEQEIRLQPTRSVAIVPTKTADGVVLVDWYATDDPANPQNWSTANKSFIMFVLCVYTWTVYCTGPVYSTATEGIEAYFGVSAIAASLGLSLYILAYGIGDLIFSPLTEIPVVGRNPVYYLTFVVFFAVSFGPTRVETFGGLLVLRFLLGFFGSPALANGGATVGDLFSLLSIPYGLCWWVFSAWAGPAFGPLIGGYAAMAKGWRWPMWEVVWMAAPTLVLLLLFMPETAPATLLLQRARRLRKRTGHDRLQSQSEIDQRNMTAGAVLAEALVRPMEIMFRDPSVFFVNLYTGYFYGVFYTFFEVFPLVFPVFYGFNLGESGLSFLSCFIGVSIAIALYMAYLYWYMVPDNKKNGFREQEHRLVPAIVGSFLMPVGLFLFAWTARSSISWAVPLVGVGIFTIGHFFTMQSLFIYLPFSYPQYAASLFAGNSLWRSGVACGSVLFARPLFINLGIARGVTLLAGLSVAGILGTAAIYIFGKQLRMRSKYAVS
ncbi:hypothetical protein SEUCBS139899_004269 [Sporothrix eucalyptigena]|uniref:Major facilitator superfamily (MFS) profile domain-containing protein n=1 Tax=Sporothrix eucalyptigena TaxID=1812306 RepID=A0ABP0BST7_9PEZI